MRNRVAVSVTVALALAEVMPRPGAQPDVLRFLEIVSRRCLHIAQRRNSGFTRILPALSPR